LIDRLHACVFVRVCGANLGMANEDYVEGTACLPAVVAEARAVTSRFAAGLRAPLLAAPRRPQSSQQQRSGRSTGRKPTQCA
jgi:hypothetical protein